jgi:anti-anti-sigma factor
MARTSLAGIADMDMTAIRGDRHALGPGLQVQVTHAGTKAIVSCTGRLAWRCDPERLVAAGCHELARGYDVVVDVSGVMAIDANGLGALARLFESAQAAGRRVSIVRARPRVRRLIEVAFGGSLPLHAGVCPVALPA